jgi:putative ABC transport system permease protein
MSRPRSERVVAWLIRRHPRPFVDAYGAAMVETFRHRAIDARAGGRGRAAIFFLREAIGLLRSALVEHGRILPSAPAHLLREIRHARRRLTASKLFAVAAVGTLGLALGATATVFTLLHRIVLEPLPYPESARLVDLDHAAPGVGIAADLGMSIGLYQEYARLPSIESIAMYYVGERTIAIRGGEDAVNAEFLHTTPSLGTVLGIRPAIGRWFVDAEGRPGGQKSVVLTHGFWQRRFGSAPAVIGTTMQVDGIAHEIVGVLPAGFAFPDERVEFAAPLALPVRASRAAGFNYQGIARLASGMTVDAARTEQNAVIADLPARFPGDTEIASGLLRTSRLSAIPQPLLSRVLGDIGNTLWVLLAATGVVLLMAAANLANLFFVRAEGRTREVVLRRALGAGRASMAAYHAAEAVLIAALGGVLALALAHAAVMMLTSGTAVDLPRLHEVRLDRTVVLFTLATSSMAALLLACAPIAHAWFTERGAAHLRQRATTAGPGTTRLRQGLIAAQVALALVLLACAGLLVRSFAHLVRADPGFRTENRLVFRIGLPGAAFRDRAAAARWHETTMERLRTIHGVRNVATTSTLPLTVDGQRDPIEVFGRPAVSDTLPVVRFLRVSTTLFDTLQIPLRRGRLFDAAAARGAADSVLVNEALVRLYFPSQDPIGARIRPMGTAGDRWLTIAGVVADTATLKVQEPEPLATMYVPIGGSLWADVPSPHEVSYILHTDRSPLAVVAQVRDLVRATNPELALAGVERFTDVEARSRAGLSFAMVLISLSAIVALVLGVVGVYAVVTYSVSQRRVEMAVRLAVGAAPHELTRMMVTQGAVPILAGVLLGLIAAGVAAPSVRALLFGVSVYDPATFILAGLSLVVVALLACWVPARRAARVSPVESLRG